VKLNSYIKSWKIFNCPSYPGGPNCANGSIPHHWVNQMISAGLVPPDFTLAYGINECLWNSWRADIGGQNIYKLARAEQPSGCVVIADSYGLANNPFRIGWANTCQAACVLENQVDSKARHKGGSVIGYLDGHAKWRKSNAFVKGLESDPNAYNWDEIRQWMRLGVGPWGNGYW